MLVRISMLVILLLWTYLWRGWTWLWSVGYILLIMLLMIVQHLRLGGLRVVLGGYCDCHRVPGGGSSRLWWNSSFCRKTQPLSGLLNTIHLENQAHCFHTFIFLSKFGIFQEKNGQFFSTEMLVCFSLVKIVILKIAIFYKRFSLTKRK